MPIPVVLRDPLVEHGMKSGREPERFVFARANSTPFNPSTIDKRARRAWKTANLRL